MPGDGDSTEATAVIEVYQDYSAIPEIDHLKNTLKISLGIGLLVLYCSPDRDGRHPRTSVGERTLSEQADQLGVLLAREQETVAELRELDRLKSDFAAAASHELRTPLTTIRGYADLLKDRGSAGDPDTRDAIDAIVRQTGHLQRLVGNLLREAQLEHGGHETREESTSIADVLGGVRRIPGSVDRILSGPAGHPEHAARSLTLPRSSPPRGQRPELLHARRPRRGHGRRSRGAR